MKEAFNKVKNKGMEYISIEMVAVIKEISLTMLDRDLDKLALRQDNYLKEDSVRISLSMDPFKSKNGRFQGN